MGGEVTEIKKDHDAGILDHRASTTTNSSLSIHQQPGAYTTGAMPEALRSLEADVRGISKRNVTSVEEETNAADYVDDLLCHNLANTSVAVAHPVDALPNAVKLDPTSAKPRLDRMPLLYYAIAGLAVLFAIIVVGVVLGATLAVDKGATSSADEMNKIDVLRAFLENVGISSQELDNPSSPHRKALEWITYEDPMEIAPFEPNFLRRFYLVSFYYETSVRHDWDFCGPAKGEIMSTSCTFELWVAGYTYSGGHATGTRWLSHLNECSWTGIECDSIKGYVKKIKLST